MAKTAANVIVGVADVYYNPGAGIAVDGAGWVELGYSEDGIVMTYTADTSDVEVEEETFPIKRVITKETVEVTCNLAENSLVNLNQALAGGVRALGVITLGAGAVKEIAVKIVGTNLGSGGATTRTIYLPYATAIGAVAQSYRKGEKTLVPVTFQAYKNASGADVCTIEDA